MTLLNKKRLLDLPRLALLGAVLLLASLALPDIAHAGQVACTPTTGFNTCYRFTYSGVDQSFTVPTGVTSMEVHAWGAAGGGANSTYWTNQGGGGGGGHAKGTITVTSGQVIGIEVGQGGDPNSTSMTYGWGGGGGNSTVASHIGGSGGGMTGVFSSTAYSQASLLVGAGGGGGASPGADVSTPNAGGGGGTTGGQDAVPGGSGRGGTQSAGGAAAITNSSCSVLPTAGGIGSGGTGGSSNNSGTPNEGGGGGGGGYWGGGGGMCQNSNTSNINGAGGGGSGFIAASVTSSSMTNGTNFPYSAGACSGTAASGGAGDALYSAGIGQGSCYASGGDGEIVIQYHAPSITMSVVSNGAVGTYTMTGNNGYAGDTITTVTSGVAASGTLDALTNAATSTTVSVSVPAGYTFTNATCTGMGSGTMTPTYVNSVSGVTQTGTLVFNTTATAAANDIACTVTLNKAATFKLQITSIGNTATFTPSASTNLASTPGAIATATAGTPAPTTPTAINITTSGSAVTVSIPAPTANWAMTAVSCTDSNSAITGNTGTFGTFSGQLMTLPAADTDYGSTITCVVTETRASVLFQKISTGGVGTFGFASNSNLASTPGSITTTVAGTAAPASPTAINVSNSGTAVTVTESSVANYALASFTCTDANASVTGNSGSFGTFASLTGTIPAGNVKAGSYITCVLTNNRPSITLTMVSHGGVTGFTFTGTNGWSSQTITTVTPGAGVSGATQSLTTASTATTITLSIPAGYSMASVSCAGLGTGTATPNLSTGAIAFDANATAAANSVSCTVTANKTPTLKLQVTTIDGTGAITFSSPVNLASTPSAISTIAVNTVTPASPTAISFNAAGSQGTLTLAPTVGLGPTSVVCTDANGAVSGNSGTFGTVTATLLTVPAANVLVGADITCVITATQATVRVQGLTLGGIGGAFSFSKTNLNSNPASVTTTAINVATPASPTANILSAMATATTITGSPAAGYYTTGGTCTDANAAVTGNSGSFGSFSSGVITIASGNVVSGSTITCVFTFSKTPTFKLQVTTTGGFGGAFSFAQTNLASAPASITTTVAATATPASPTAINVSTIGTAVTVTGTPASGFDLNAVSCTDTNAGVTGNSGIFGSIASNVMTVASAKVVAGADFVCVLSSNKLATLTLTMKSNGGVTGFTFTGTNGWSSQTITTVTAGTGVAGATQILTAVSTATTVTQSIPSGYAVSSVSCTGLGSGSVTPTLGTGAMLFDALATAPGNAIACTVTDDKLATFKLQVTSLVGTTTFTPSASTNLASTPGAITTITAGTAAPASPTATNVNSFGASISVTTPAPTGYALTGASCTDSNSAITGNSGTFGSFSGTVLTVASANVVAGASFTCVLTETRSSIAFQIKSLGGYTNFTFYTSNILSTPSITTTALNTTTPASPTAIAIPTMGSDVTISNNNQGAGAWYITALTCTDANAAITGNTGSFATFLGYGITIPAANVVAGAAITCVATETRIPAFTIQMQTVGGYGGPFYYSQTNLTMGMGPFTTTAANTPVPTSLTTVFSYGFGTAITVNQTAAAGFALTSVVCTDSNSAITGNTGTFVTVSSTQLTIPGANVVAGADFQCMFTNTKLPSLTLTEVSTGGVGNFTFTGDNGWSSQTITTVASGTGVAGTTQYLSAFSTATTISHIIPSGYTITSIACTGQGIGTYTPNIGTGTVAFNAAAVPAGATLACTYSHTKTPTFKLQLTTTGGFGGAFSFSQTNLASAPSNITTTAAATATPVSPAAINISTIGTAITVTGTSPSGFDLNAVSCTDTNASITGNTGTFGSIASNVLTVSSAKVVAGADFLCVLSSNKLATLTLTMKSNGGVTGFTFTGTNGWSSQTITTLTPGTGVAGATQILTAASTATTVTQSIPSGYAFSSVSCTGLGSGSVTPTLSSGAMLFNALATAPGNTIACTITDDKNATISLAVISLGGTGNFSFSAGANVAITSGTIPTITDGVAAPSPLVPVGVNSLGTAITFTEAPAAGYALTSFNCTDSNSAINGNSGNFGSFTGNAISISSSNVAAGGQLVCTATFTRPRVRIQKVTLGGSSGPFTFSATNLASTPGSITTTAVSTATPASPTPINVTTVGSAVTITEPAFGGYFTNAASCTDANATITGNSGSLGTLSGSTLTLPAGAVKAGADFTCIFTNTKGVPSLSIVKTASSLGPFSVGQTITYTYKVTNTGNVAVANVAISDSHNGSGSLNGPAGEVVFNDVAPLGDSTDLTANDGTWSSLGPGDTVSFTASYVVTQHDVDYLQ